ncbi:SDR family oxidoreductase [Gleimia europaea]|uniref:SDR family oxidoreductase n=1 Tax=Gleimia europaea TaxID=66228 RepID=UPI002783BE38|nr:SDR family oxidoreductase [Gleimia europaea]MDP9834531.1 NADP-dependent 3-hydroxy acid dehydrogenase YdfG [Gleimia europaea]
MSRKTVLVTGGSRGIGRAICEGLSKDWHVLVGGRSDAAGSVASALESAQPWVVDITDEEAVREACAKIDQLDALVLNAGISMGKTIAEATREDWETILNVNVIAQAGLVKHLLPALRKARGQVVAINSGSGFNSKAGGGLYSASKFALRAMTDALREEERGTVRVSSVHPGRVDTDMQVQIQEQAGRDYNPGDHVRPDSIAKVVRLALEATEDATVEVISVRPVHQI